MKANLNYFLHVNYILVIDYLYFVTKLLVDDSRVL